MSNFPKLLFFLKVLVGMSIPMILAAWIYGPWWVEEGIIIPFLFLANAIFSFYFVYKAATFFHFPLRANSILPVMYGMLVPFVIAGFLYLMVTIPIKPVLQDGANIKFSGVTPYDDEITLFFVSNFVAATLTFVFTWLGIKIWDSFKSKNALEKKHFF